MRRSLTLVFNFIKPQLRCFTMSSNSSVASGVTQVPSTANIVTIDPPKIGGQIPKLKPDDKDIFFVGGKPAPDWTAAEFIEIIPDSPYRYRALAVSTDSKDYHYRTAPLKVILKSTVTNATELAKFRRALEKRVKAYGLDTVFYVPSLTNSQVMVSVITDHNQLTIKHVETASKKIKEDHFDHWLTQDNTAARTLLENSFDSDLNEKLDLVSSVDDTAAIFYMRAMKIVQDGSVNRYERMKTAVKALSPKDHPGENVPAYTMQLRTYFKELSAAGMFEWTLLLHTVQVLATVSEESFAAHFRDKTLPLTHKIQAIQLLDKKAADQAMRDDDLHWEDLFTYAEDSYQLLHSNGKWGPASMPTDKRAPKLEANLAKMNLTATQINQVRAHIQSQVDKRYNAKVKSQNNNDNSGNGNDNNNDDSNSRKPPATTSKWREIPPKDGEPTTKVVKGKTFHWCSKCRGGKGLWQSTHKTDTHDPSKSKHRKQRTNEQANLGATGTPPPDPDNNGNDGVSWFTDHH